MTLNENIVTQPSLAGWGLRSERLLYGKGSHEMLRLSSRNTAAWSRILGPSALSGSDAGLLK